MTDKSTSTRTRRRSRPDRTAAPAPAAVWPGVPGGYFKPLTEDELGRIHRAALDVLEHVGIGDAPEFVVARVTARGGSVSEHGRLLFPRSLVEDLIAGCPRGVVLHGQRPNLELELSGGKTYVGSGGAAPSMVDVETNAYRDSTLRDLFDAARVVDHLEHVHFFSRSVVARDMPSPLLLDVNTAYACLRGTAKHVSTSATDGASAQAIAELCRVVAGDEREFAARPFLSLNVNHVVPPLRFAAGACEVLERAAELDIPVHINSLGQAGASSPASLAGSLVQAVAETLAGMVFVQSVNPHARMVFGPRPLVTDLRTGGMTGGCGEQAVLMAAAVQMGRYYDLPNSCIAGATDSKIPDAQSGYEKALCVGLAAHAGCNMITQACGMQAGLMGCSLESYVIDNDMLGAILRSVRGIEVDDQSIAWQPILDVVVGDGHFLGTADTYTRMQSDFLYPDVADRQSASDWLAAGGTEVRERARAKVREIMAEHFPAHLSPRTDVALRAQFDIRLPESALSGVGGQ